MQRTSFEQMNCSVAKTVAVIGEPWTPLILRDVYFGITRFDAIQADLGISRKVLAERLGRLVEEAVLARVPYQDKPPRYDYELTAKGSDLALVLVAMKAWGDRWAPSAEGERMLLRHESCGAIIHPVASCSSCGEVLHADEVTALPGPGLTRGPGTEGLFDVLAARSG